MNTTQRLLSTLLLLVPSLILGAGCSDRDPAGLEKGIANTDPVVFDDAYGEGIYFQPFFETHYLAASIDSVFAYGGLATYGARSLKIEVPPIGSALGPYSGGVLTPASGRDLSAYNALTLRVRTNAPGTRLNVCGFGNDNTGTSLYETSRGNLELTRDWTYRIVPIPDSSKLINERGLFLFAEAAEETYPEGYDVWFDEIEFARVEGLEHLRSQLLTPSSLMRRYFNGMSVGIGGASSIYSSTDEGGNIIVNHSSRYFEIISSSPSVAVPTDRGDIRIVGEGEAQITAKLQDIDVIGGLRLTGYAPPASGAPAPTLPAGNVISLFSDVYADAPVDTWKADWDGVSTQYQEYSVGGDHVKLYYDMNYFGIEFLTRPVDASQMTHIHLDVYAEEGTQFEVKLESLLGSGLTDDTVVFLREDTVPAFLPGGWSSLDIPLADFQVPAEWDWSQLVRLILGASVDTQLILVDNVYWYKQDPAAN